MDTDEIKTDGERCPCGGCLLSNFREIDTGQENEPILWECPVCWRCFTDSFVHKP